MDPKNCPKCNKNLEGQDIFEFFFERYQDEERALSAAKMYGWTKENPCCFRLVIGMYSLEDDKTTHWKCPECDHTWER